MLKRYSFIPRMFFAIYVLLGVISVRKFLSIAFVLFFLLGHSVLSEANQPDLVWNAYVKQIQEVSESADTPNSKLKEITSSMLNQLNVMRKKIVSQELKIQRMEKELSEKGSSGVATRHKFKCVATREGHYYHSEAIGIYKAMQDSLDKCFESRREYCALYSCMIPFENSRLNDHIFQAFRQNFYVNHWTPNKRQ